MLPISVFIITKNEEDRIEQVINAAKEIADEILSSIPEVATTPVKSRQKPERKFYLISGKVTVSKRFLAKVNVAINGF